MSQESLNGFPESKNMETLDQKYDRWITELGRYNSTDMLEVSSKHSVPSKDEEGNISDEESETKDMVEHLTVKEFKDKLEKRDPSWGGVYSEWKWVK